MENNDLFKTEGIKFPKFLPEVGDIIQVVLLNKVLSQVYECEVLARRGWKDTRKNRVPREFSIVISPEAFYFDAGGQSFIGHAEISYSSGNKKRKARMHLDTWFKKGGGNPSKPCAIKIVRKASRESI